MNKLMKTPFKSNHLRAQDATGAEPEPELPIREVREVLDLLLPWRWWCWAISQWEFQDPKLEVPTIYKASIRPM